MTRLDPDSEGTLEVNAIGLFESLGWEAADCYHETYGPNSMLGRETSEQVVLERRIRAALLKLNPGITPLAIDLYDEESISGGKVKSPVRSSTPPASKFCEATFVLREPMPFGRFEGQSFISSMHYCYILRCADGSFYVGVAEDP
jgi:hypothetical protein